MTTDRLNEAIRQLEVTLIDVCPVGPAKQQVLRKLEELKCLARGAVDSRPAKDSTPR